MKINIDVSCEELNEMGFDEFDLVDYIIETLDGNVKELVVYQVNVNSKGVINE